MLGVFNQKLPLSLTISVQKLAARYSELRNYECAYGIVSTTMVPQLNGRDKQACDGKMSKDTAL